MDISRDLKPQYFWTRVSNWMKLNGSGPYMKVNILKFLELG